MRAIAQLSYYLPNQVEWKHLKVSNKYCLICDVMARL